MKLPEFADKRRVVAALLLGDGAGCLPIDMSCPRGAQQQTRRSGCGTMRRRPPDCSLA